MNRPIVVDLFAGVGGLSLGAEKAGFTVACAVEIDIQAVKAHTRNFPNTKHLSTDVRHLTSSILKKTLDVSEIDGIIGGPPCQGFSYIGQGSTTDSRNELFGEFFRLVSEVKPKFFLAENVPGILQQKYSQIVKHALGLVEADYNILDPITIDASKIGLPTRRKRVFFIGIRKDFSHIKLNFENKTHTVKDALCGIPDIITESNFSSQNTVELCHISDYSKWISDNYPDHIGDPMLRQDYYSNRILTGYVGTRHSPEVEYRYSQLGAGQKDQVSRAVRLDPNGFAPTLRAGTNRDKGSYQAVRPIHPTQPRVITPREGARLQGFPDWFAFDETKWHAFRQIGNSVPPLVAWQIFEQIFQIISKPD